MDNRKGVSIISEVILAIGIIGVAILFSLVATDIIDFSRGSFTGSAQQGMLEDISFRIDTITASSGETRFTYNPTFSQYTLETRENHTLEIQLEGEETQSATFHAIRLRDTFIDGSEAICIHGNSREIAIDPGNCSSTGLTDICEDGCDLQECRPDLGADCTTPACTYPDDAEAEDASAYCDPSYDPDYINGENSTVGIGWVNQSFVGSQGEQDQCTQDFECSGSLECNPSTEGSDSFCCPSGEQYDPTQDACVENNDFDVVYVPIGFDPGEEDTYQSLAADMFEYYAEDKSPFRECSDPTNHVQNHTTDDIEDACDFDSSDCGQNWYAASEPRSAWTGCWAEVRDCATQIYGSGDWDEAHGICHPGQPCSAVGGKAKWFDQDVSFTDTASIGSPEKTGAHELGHTHGLLHVEAGCGASGGCAGPNQDDCGLSNDDTFLMSYCSGRTEYGPNGYAHMNNSYLDPYLGGGCP